MNGNEWIAASFAWAEVQSLGDQAHVICPYSKATRGNAHVEIVATEP